MSRASTPPSIAIHGGAGNLEKYRNTGRLEQSEIFLASVIDELYADATGGLSAIDLVTQAVVRLEDCGLFHAGKGSSPNSRGVVEMDASIMRGDTQQAAGVIAVSTVKNPILLSRYIMENTPHVLLFGAAAEDHASNAHVERVAESYYVPCDEIGAAINAEERSHGTVGAVARDIRGLMAAATSTGGILRKAAGRVGDSPIIGAGTFARNLVSAVSCTGIGEFFIRTAAASQIISRMELLGETAVAATGHVLESIHRLGGEGGMITVGQHGEIAMLFNTQGMYRAAIDSRGERTVAIL